VVNQDGLALLSFNKLTILLSSFLIMGSIIRWFIIVSILGRSFFCIPTPIAALNCFAFLPIGPFAISIASYTKYKIITTAVCLISI